MKVKAWQHDGVDKNGVVQEGGAVNTTPGVGFISGGCGMEDCHCSDGYHMVINEGLKDGTVKGVTITFDSKEEMLDLLKAWYMGAKSHIRVR